MRSSEVNWMGNISELNGGISLCESLDSIKYEPMPITSEIDKLKSEIDKLKAEVNSPNGVSVEYHKEIKVIPDIKDINVVKDNEGNDRAVIVFFVDGTKEKAVCATNDVFSLEIGISICLFKKILSTGGNSGSKRYNSLITRALKVKARNDAAKANEQIKAEETKRIAENKRRKAQKKSERRKSKQHEELVSIYEEAIKRAMNAAKQ